MTDEYRQCVLTRGDARSVAWVGAKFAQVGRLLRFGESNGWTVREVGARATSDDLALHREARLDRGATISA